MSGTTATGTAIPAGPVPIVPTTEERWLSARHLSQSSYLGVCPGCDSPRLHRAAGLRRCPGCRTYYRLVVTTVIGGTSNLAPHLEAQA